MTLVPRIRDEHAVGRRLAALACLMLMTAAPARGQAGTGVEDYRNGDFQAALRKFEDGAAAGDKRAQYNLGVMLLKGTGIQKNTETALKWHRLSAEQGYAAAQHELGVMFYRGDGVAQNHAAAAKWFRKAAEQDFAQAQLNLGVMYFAGHGVPKDGAEVVKWITLAAAKGLAEAQYRLGAMYDKGMVFRSDRGEAERWCEKASRQGHEKSGTRLAALAASRLAAVAPASGSRPDAGELATKTAATPVTAAATSSAERTAWRVQLASFRSTDDAEVAWRRLTRRHPELLDGLEAKFVEADLGPERGIYHRLTAGPLDSGDAARALCRNIRERAPGQGCLPLSR